MNYNGQGGEQSIDFANVTNEVQGCGFRHEEFPNITIEDTDRVNFIAFSKQRDYLHKMLFDIPENLANKTLDAFIRGIISLKIETSLNIDNWWDNAYRKYNLPPNAKYNSHTNKIYRHITDDNQITNLDRNPNFFKRNNGNNGQFDGNQNGNQNNNNQGNWQGGNRQNN
jgi:hypothetical protein